MEIQLPEFPLIFRVINFLLSSKLEIAFNAH